MISKKESIKGYFAIALIIILLCISSYLEHNYTRECIVIDITNNVVVFEDTTGNYWEWEIEDKTTVTVVVGDRVELTMNDNCSIGNIYDDIITGIKLVQE